MGRLRMRSKALSFIARSWRTRVGPVLVLVISSIGHLPGAGGDLGIGGGQVGARDLEVEHGLAEGFVLGVEEGLGFRFVLGSEAGLLAGGGVLGVEDAGAPEQDEPLIHNDAFHVMNREAVRHYRVSS